MPLTINIPITLDDATLAALRAALGATGPVVTPPPVEPPPVVPPPVDPVVPAVAGYTAVRQIMIPWGDYSRKYSKDVGGLHETDLLLVKFTVPADATVGKTVSINGAEWIDNGQPREACLSLSTGDFSGASLGQGSKSEGTSFGVSFVVGPPKPWQNVFKPGMPGIMPGTTAYLNVRSRGGGGDPSVSCNVFVAMK
jgi:hypothetical protein